MKKYNWNNNGTEDELLHNEFTAYLVLSIKRYRTQYIFREKQRRQKEDLLSFQDKADDESPVQSTTLSKAFFLHILQEEELYNSFKLEDMISDETIYNAYSQLPKNAKKIVSLKLLLDLTFHEIAEVLGFSEIYVKNTYYRSLNKMKNLIHTGGKNK